MDDGLPMLICAQCIYQLNCSFKFKTQCENSDATLRKYLSNNMQVKNEVSIIKIDRTPIHMLSVYRKQRRHKSKDLS
jgi:hypothetical protein